MGLYDRDYTQEGFRSPFHRAPQMRMTFPKTTPVVKRLLIINIAVFLATIAIRPLGIFIYEWFQLDATSVPRALQLWRLITYQFLHAGMWHLAFNMLWLYFLGPTLERHWGSKKFLTFYLSCGAAGALFYLLLVAVNFLPAIPMVGASGAILGIFAACAILFPQIVIYLFPLPVAIPIRVAAVAGIAMYIFFVITRGPNAGGDAAHLAGMAAGAFYVLSKGWRTRLKSKTQSGQWRKKITDQRNLQVELDRILQKVHDYGIRSLTSKEKKILKQATKAQQRQNHL